MFQYAYGRSNFKDVAFDRSGIVPPRTYALDPFRLDIKFQDNSPDALSGYWQGEKYFCHDVVRSEFSKSNPLFEDTCFIGVRRSDYLLPERINYHGVMPIEYYDLAMSYVRERVPNVKFVCFADDWQWAYDHFGLRAIHNGDATDIWLMARCPYAIIANSSFHWWGAWLGPQNIVVAPKRWFATPNPSPDCLDIVPERWTRI